MIKITNGIADISTISSQYPQNSIQRIIINKMNESTVNYVYSSVNQLKFELDLRKNIITASRELNNSDMVFRVFRRSKCNEQYWKRTAEGGFQLKEGVKASEAIKDIFINGSQYGTECATAMVIVYYKAILYMYPESLYNEVFSHIHLLNWHYIDRDLSKIGYIEEDPDSLPGDRRYFKNPDVDPQTPEWQGENVIDLGNGTYYGHGVGIKTGFQIINKLNARRKSGARRSAYLLDGASNPDFKHLANMYFSYMGRFDTDIQESSWIRQRFIPLFRFSVNI